MAGAPQPTAAGRRDLRHGLDRHRRSAAAIEDGRRGNRPRLLARTEPVWRATPPDVVAHGVADDAGRASSDYLNQGRTATDPADDADPDSSSDDAGGDAKAGRITLRRPRARRPAPRWRPALPGR